MNIDPARCIGCGSCAPYCPAEAIVENGEGGWKVLEGACFECGLCRTAQVCLESAFIETAETAFRPRVLRSLFSDPNTMHRSTMSPGRGTEESKTNDVTGRVRRGDIGLCIELGRPGTGCSLGDVSRMTERLKSIDVRFISGNPLVSLMDEETARLADDLLEERVLSAIVEVVFHEAFLERVLDEVFELGRELDTVFSLSLITRFAEDGGLPVLDRLAALGLAPAGGAKVNMGLGSIPAPGGA